MRSRSRLLFLKRKRPQPGTPSAGFFVEPLPGMPRHNGTGGLQFSVLVQRHQALFSLGALRFLLAYFESGRYWPVSTLSGLILILRYLGPGNLNLEAS
jgi:hypothetical protein